MKLAIQRVSTSKKIIILRWGRGFFSFEKLVNKNAM